MLLQINCINNGVTNGLKSKKGKKPYKTALYSKIKERRQTRGEWLTGAHTQNIPHCKNTTKDKKMAYNAPIDESKRGACAQACEARINDM